MNIRDDEYEEIEYKKVKHCRKEHKKKHYFLKIMILIGIIAAGCYFLSTDYFTVKKIDVKGNRYYTKKEVKAIASAQTGKNMFFKSGISEMKERLEKEPYFDQVKIRRRPPDRIVIDVNERKQAAAVACGKEYIVIDQNGTVLRKTNEMPKLTVLTGITVSSMNPGEKIEAEEKETLDSTLKLLDTVMKGNLYFKYIDFSKVVVRAYIYDSLVVKGTAGELKKVIESGNLQKLVESLLDDGIRRGTVSVGGNDYMSFSPEIE